MANVSHMRIRMDVNGALQKAIRQPSSSEGMSGREQPRGSKATRPRYSDLRDVCIVAVAQSCLAVRLDTASAYSAEASTHSGKSEALFCEKLVSS